MTVMNLEKYKILALVAPEFEDLEFWVPVFRLREEGAQVIIAGAKASETYKGKGGLLATSDVSFNGLEADEFDGLIIPGGWAPDKLRRYDSVKYLVHALNQRHKIIGMICHAGLVGISAGIVAGHEATRSEGIRDDLVNAGAVWQDKPAFRSKNLVWGRVVPDIPDYCRELVLAFCDRSTQNGQE